MKTQSIKLHQRLTTYFRHLVLVVILIGGFIPTAFAQAASVDTPSDPVFIVIYSRPTLAEAAELALDYKKRFSSTSVWQAANGQYAVILGAIERTKAGDLIRQLIAEQSIPDDSFASTPTSWNGPYRLDGYIAGSSGSSRNAVASTPAATAALSFGGTFSLNTYEQINIVRDPSYYGYITRELRIPANNLVTVTTYRRTGKADIDTYIVSSIDAGDFNRPRVKGKIAENTSADDGPNVTIIPPSSTDRVLYLYLAIERRDDSQYFVSAKATNMVGIFVRAGGNVLVQKLGEAIIESITGRAPDHSAGSRNEVTDRALPLAISILTRKDWTAVTMDLAFNEMRIALRNTFPDNPGAVTFGMSLFKDLFYGIYGDSMYFAGNFPTR